MKLSALTLKLGFTLTIVGLIYRNKDFITIVGILMIFPLSLIRVVTTSNK